MTGDGPLTRAALHVHVFASADSIDPGTRSLLERLWDACGRFGMDRPTSGFSGLTFPDLPDGHTGFHQLAARTNVDPSQGAYQAALYAAGGVIGLMVVLAPPDNDPAAPVWRDLDERWRRETGPAFTNADHLRGLLGTVTLYRVLSENALSGSNRALGERLFRLLPGSEPVAVPEPLSLAAGILAWEATSTDAPTSCADRRFIVTAPPTETDDHRLDAWVWAAGPSRQVPLTRYLMHAAELRHQSRVLQDAEERLHRLRRRLHHDSDRVLADIRALLTPPHSRRHELARIAALGREAETLLLETRSRVAESGDLRTMQITAQISIAALEGDLKGPDGGTGPGMFPSDQECADRISAALDSGTSYLSIAQERAAEAARIAYETVTQRLQQHQQQLTVLQTSVLGSLLMALAAIQTLQYRLPLPGPVQGPLIAFLAALALCLPSILLRRWRGHAGGRIANAFDTLGLLAMGGAGGWLACAVLRAVAGSTPVVWPIASSCAAVGALLTLTLGTMRLNPR